MKMSDGKWILNKMLSAKYNLCENVDIWSKSGKFAIDEITFSENKIQGFPSWKLTSILTFQMFDFEVFVNIVHII